MNKMQKGAERLFMKIHDRLLRASVPVKEAYKIMDMIADYGEIEAEIEAELYRED